MGRDTDMSRLEESASSPKSEVPVNFDPSIPAGRGINATATSQRGLRYNGRTGEYVDFSGCPQLDRYGQPLG